MSRILTVIVVLCILAFSSNTLAITFDTSTHTLVTTPFRISAATQDSVWQHSHGLSPVLRKMESAILELITQTQPGAIPAGPNDFVSWAKIDTKNKVYVYLYAATTTNYTSTDILTALMTNGINPVSYNASIPLVSAWVDIDTLKAIAANPSVASIRLVTNPHRSGHPVISKGDTLMRAPLAKQTWPTASGANVAVGVISDDCGSKDYVNGASGQTLLGQEEVYGELPAVTPLDDTYSGIRTHEGLALMEIIHDLAPSSTLFFAQGCSDMAAFASNILNLQTFGCRVICDDILFFEEPFFEDGPIAQAIANVVKSENVAYITAAGNYRQDVHSFTFTGARATINDPDGTPDSYNVNDFGGSHYWDPIYIPNGAELDARLQWNEPFDNPLQHYNLFLYNVATGRIIYRTSTSSSALQTIQKTNNTGQGAYWGLIVQTDQMPTHPPEMKLLVWSSNRMLTPGYNNGIASVLGHSMSSNAIACGAISALDPNASGLEPYSSTGPVGSVTATIGASSEFGHMQGDPVNSLRIKPDVVSFDQVASDVHGFESFTGTSAAAAHVAGLAAMIRSEQSMVAHPMTAQQVENAIRQHAVSLGASVQDKPLFGYGWPDAYTIINAIPH